MRGGGGEGKRGKKKKRKKLKKLPTFSPAAGSLQTKYPRVGTLLKVVMFRQLLRFFLASSKAACLEAHALQDRPRLPVWLLSHHHYYYYYETNDESDFPMWSVLGSTYHTQPVKLCVNYQQQQSRIAPPPPPPAARPPFPGGTDDPQRTLPVRQQM